MESAPRTYLESAPRTYHAERS